MVANETIMKRLVIVAAVLSLVVLLAAGDILAAAWPEKGKTMTMYIPAGAGGGQDMAARTMARFLEPELGTKIVIINKPGGGNQVGITEYLSKVGTDGYTIASCSTPIVPSTYLDPERKAPYSLKDIQLIANYGHTSIAVAVKKGSPYKNLKDLVAAAKANPNKIRGTASGPMSPSDDAIILLERAAGVSFAHMFFDQQGEQRAALLGGHADAEFNMTFELVPGQKSGETETIAIFDPNEDSYFPGVPTAEKQGYKVYMYSGFGLAYKTGTPKEIVDIIAAAVKSALAKPACIETFKKIGVEPRPLFGQEYAAYWKYGEDVVRTVLEDMAKKKK
jgi:tripartite-type tricarboxylate transporter receptor subunit TctC